MDERIKQEKMPVRGAIDMDILNALEQEMQEALKKFALLPGKIQEDIMSDIKQKREAGIRPAKIWVRLYSLIKHGQSLEDMSTEYSDKLQNPKPSLADLERQEAEAVIGNSVDVLIGEIEKIRQRDNFQPKGVDRYKH